MKTRTLSNIYRIGIQRILKRGIRITIIPSYACNYSCAYCGRRMGLANPRAPLKSLEEWKVYLIDLDKTFKIDGSRIKEIILTGGEPTLLPYFHELCNFITQRWLLTIYTNLSEKALWKFYMVNTTTRLIVHSTFHATQTSSKEFNQNWEQIDQFHRVVVDEIGERRLADPHRRTRLKAFATEKDLRTNLATLRVDPNHAAYVYCVSDAIANTVDINP